jgi:hypothetical protein
LKDGDRVEADDGFLEEAPLHVKCPASFFNPREKLAMQSKLSSRHEIVHKRSKQWGALTQKFRHPKPQHGIVVRDIAGIAQISIGEG